MKEPAHTNQNGSTSVFEIEKKFKIITFNDDQCDCDVCGKQELKGTYLMENLSNGELFRAGSTCGAKMAGWSTKELVDKYKAGEKEKIEAARTEWRNSLEFNAEVELNDFLNKESDELERRIFATSNLEERKSISKTRRTFESRMELWEPLRLASSKKKSEINAKYNLKHTYYF